MIETHDLRRTFKSRRSARSRRSVASTSASARARSSASSARTGPARRRRCGCSRRCSRPPSGEATVAGADLRREPAAGPRADRLRPPGRLDRSGRDRPRRARHPGPAVRHEQADGPGARGRGARGARPRGGRRSHDEHLLGRDEAPARRRPRHRPPAGGAVPRRADDRPRPAGARADVGRDPRACARAARRSS